MILFHFAYSIRNLQQYIYISYFFHFASVPIHFTSTYVINTQIQYYCINVIVKQLSVLVNYLFFDLKDVALLSSGLYYF